MEQYRPTGFRVLPPVVKNLLIINGLFFLATYAFHAAFRIDLVHKLGMHYFGSELFKPYQMVTYMFMHDPYNFGHILSNMFALWMFGSLIENTWGAKRFLSYYMATGIGAILIQMLINYIQINSVTQLMTQEQIDIVMSQGSEISLHSKNFVDPLMAELNSLYNAPTIGASGAVFGILLAFGMTFPNMIIYIYFLIPLKAKYFVIFYGALEFFLGVKNYSGDNVAHFAHLGGMLFGFFMIMYWKKKKPNNNYFG